MRRQLITSVLATLVLALIVGIIYPLVVWAIGQSVFPWRANGSFVKNSHGQVIGSALIGQEFLDAKGNPLPQYFQPRPSSAGTGYTANASAASNLGPADPRLVGFIPGLNTVSVAGEPSKTNPFATPADPYCVPMDASSDSPVLIPTAGERFQMTNGQYECDPNTVPERRHGLPPIPTTWRRRPRSPSTPVTGSFSGLDPDISVANADLQAARVANARHLPRSLVMTLVRKHTDGRFLGVVGERTVNVLDLNRALDASTR